MAHLQLVYIYYDISKRDELPAMPDFNLTLEIIDFVKSLPVRFSATHFCLKARPDKLDFFNSLMQLLLTLSPNYRKVRSRLHYGSDIELQYQLRGHGINTDSSPINSDGALRDDIRNDWFYEHLRTERRGAEDPSVQPFASLPNEDAWTDENKQRSDNEPGDMPIITPTDDDILLGRGRSVQYNPGNVRFRMLAASKTDEYDTAPRHRRQEIVSEVARGLSSEGVRFLKQIDADVWVQCNDKETKKKITQLYREFRKKK